MRAKNTISISEARKKIFDIAEEVQKPGVYYTFTEKGKPKVVLMSVEEFESWMETLEVKEAFPDLENDIKKARAEYERGEYVTLKDLLVEEGFVLADKPKKKYALHGHRAKKSPKGNK